MTCCDCESPLVGDEKFYCAECIDAFVIEWNYSIPTPTIWETE